MLEIRSRKSRCGEAGNLERGEFARTVDGVARDGLIEQVKVQIPSRPTGSAAPRRTSQTDHMNMILKRWRHKRSPAARRGYEAAREYTARVAKQQTLTQGRDGTAAAEKR